MEGILRNPRPPTEIAMYEWAAMGGHFRNYPLTKFM